MVGTSGTGHTSRCEWLMGTDSLHHLPSTTVQDNSKSRSEDLPSDKSGSRHNSSDGPSPQLGIQSDPAPSTTWSDAHQTLNPIHLSPGEASVDLNITFNDDFEGTQSLVQVDDQAPDSWVGPGWSGYPVFQFDDINQPSLAKFDFFSFANEPLQPQIQESIDQHRPSISTPTRKPEMEDVAMQSDISWNLVEEL